LKSSKLTPPEPSLVQEKIVNLGKDVKNTTSSNKDYSISSTSSLQKYSTKWRKEYAIFERNYS